MTEKRDVLVLGRRDHAEAMRVAAGLTIFGHRVRLVFMTHPVAETEENAEQAELLELADIVPQASFPDPDLEHLDAVALAAAVSEADSVINL